MNLRNNEGKISHASYVHFTLRFPLNQREHGPKITEGELC